VIDTWSFIEVRIAKIVEEHLNVEADKVRLDADVTADLGADSLDKIELVMAYEEEFGVEVPDDAAETIQTPGDAIDRIFSIYSKGEQVIDVGAGVISFRVREDGKIEAGLQQTDGSWVFAGGAGRLPCGIYIAAFNKWSAVLRELEELVNDQRIRETDLQRFFEKHPELLKGDEYDRIVPQAVIAPDHRKVNWRADFVLHPHSQTDFCKIIELKLPSVPVVKAERSGHRDFYRHLNSAVQQLRDYGEAFANADTRERFKGAYGMDVFKPDLQLVIGRKWDVAQIGVMLERQRRDSLGIVDWDTLVDKLRRKFT